MRTFIAIELDELIREALSPMMEALKRSGEKIKLVERENIHLTLKFLGEIPEESLPEALGIMENCCLSSRRFRMRLKGVGAFPNMAKPKILFIPVFDKPEMLAALAGRLNEEFASLGVEPEERAFRSHVTIGRFKFPAPAPRLAKRLEPFREMEFGEMEILEITIFKSELTADGPIYQALGRVKLKE